MKSIRKILFVMAALAAVFGFVACSDDDDDGPLVVAMYEYKDTWTAEDGTTEYSDTYTAFFYNDGSFIVTSVGNDDEGSWNYIEQTGVYTGDPSKDGTIKITVEKKNWYYDDGNMKLLDIKDYIKAMYVTEVTDDFINNIIREAYTNKPITITGGKANIDGDEYTKK